MSAADGRLGFWLVAALLIALAVAVVVVPLLRQRRLRLALALAVALPIAAVGGYLGVGNPEAIVAERDVLARFEAPRSPDEARRLAQRLETHLARTPRDARAWVLLARLRGLLDDFPAAVSAYERALAANTRVARDPQVLAELADALGMANGGTLAGRPRALALQALSLDARHPKALDLAGSAAYKAGEYAAALAHWETLLATLSPASREHAELSAAIARLRREAGLPDRAR